MGLVLGTVGGAVLAWAAGAVLAWQRELAFTLGVARTLLPFGDQLALLRWVSSTWYLVIPIVGMAVAVFSALVGGLIGALLGCGLQPFAASRQRRRGVA